MMNNKPIKIYLSGAITDNPSYKDMFAEAESKCLAAGYTPISPVKLDYDNFSYQDYLMADLAILSRCDGIYLIEGWENSKGACAEYAVARALGLILITDLDLGLTEE